MTETLEALNLTLCDREPVHLAGAIQPHGALLVVTEPDLRIVQASANAASFLQLPEQSLVGQTLAAVLDPEDLAPLRSRLDSASLTAALVHVLTLPGRSASERGWHLFANRRDGLLILEFERASATVPTDRSTMQGAALIELRDAFQRLHHTDTLSDFLAVLVQHVRALTGFERVMAYRFDWDGSGEIVAESLGVDGLPPYLGLHYPASDIPAPARRLFACSPVRHIPDVAYVPVPLLPVAPDATQGQPVDLSYSFLRSVSPVHLTYLSNMGSRATLVMPLMKGDRLWGLVACAHHSAPRYLPYEHRIPVEVLTQTAALMLSQREDREHGDYRERLHQVRRRLTERFTREGGYQAALMSDAPTLLSVIEAGGVALVVDGEVSRLGRTPTEQACVRLSGWLEAHDEPLFTTHCLETLFPETATWRSVAAGVLSVRLTGADRILWFRPEVVADVHWAGDPHKPVVQVDGDDAEPRLQPRASFALWKESVSGRSKPWLDCEGDHAMQLRQAILFAIAERARVLERLNAELERHNRELDAFAYAASHDLREPLRGIHNFVELLEREETARLSERGLQRLGTIRRLLVRMDTLLAALLHYARAAREELALDLYPIGDLAAEAEAIIRQAHPDVAFEIRLQPDLPQVRCDRARVVMIFQNLIANGVKYNDSAHKCLEIGADTRVDPPVFFVRDNGIGIVAEHHELVFGLFRRLHGREADGGGTGAGLTIVKQAVKRHHGRIWLESTPGRGTTFYFTLAPERVDAASI